MSRDKGIFISVVKICYCSLWVIEKCPLAEVEELQESIESLANLLPPINKVSKKKLLNS